MREALERLCVAVAALVGFGGAGILLRFVWKIGEAVLATGGAELVAVVITGLEIAMAIVFGFWVSMLYLIWKQRFTEVEERLAHFGELREIEALPDEMDYASIECPDVDADTGTDEDAETATESSETERVLYHWDRLQSAGCLSGNKLALAVYGSKSGLNTRKLRDILRSEGVEPGF